MKTQERILAKALSLFNAEGVKEVTLRKIARSLDMSQGNLNYHFKTKGDIIAALYYELVEKMNTEMHRITTHQPLLALVYESSLVSMEILYAYRFLLKDLYAILQSDETLRVHYLTLQKQREKEYLTLFQHMIAEGIIREAAFDGEYNRLYQRMNILGDNWVNAAILFHPDQSTSVEYFHQLLFEIIYPYLTDKGKEEYKALLQSRK